MHATGRMTRVPHRVSAAVSRWLIEHVQPTRPRRQSTLLLRTSPWAVAWVSALALFMSASTLLESSNPWAVRVALAAVLTTIVIRLARSQIYVEGSRVVVKGLIRTRAFELSQVLSVEPPPGEWGVLTVALTSGGSVRLWVARNIGRTRDDLRMTLLQLVEQWRTDNPAA